MTNFEEAYFAGDWSHDMYRYSIETAFPAGQHVYVLYVYISQHCEACTLWQQTLEGLCTRCNADTDIQLKQHCCVHTHTHAHTHTCRHFFVLLAQFKGIVTQAVAWGPVSEAKRLSEKGLDS